MKKIFLISIVFFTINAFSQNKTSKQIAKNINQRNDIKTQKLDSIVNWISFEEAQNLAKTNPKKVYVDVYTDWCGWCKRMDATTFSNPVIARYMNKNFYCIKFNAETHDTIILNGKKYYNPAANGQRGTHQLALFLTNNELKGYPTSLYLNESFTNLQTISNYFDAAGLEPILHFFSENVYIKSKPEVDAFYANFKSELKK